jgi:hypothetical protein
MVVEQSSSRSCLLVVAPPIFETCSHTIFKIIRQRSAVHTNPLVFSHYNAFRDNPSISTQRCEVSTLRCDHFGQN